MGECMGGTDRRDTMAAAVAPEFEVNEACHPQANTISNLLNVDPLAGRIICWVT